jgi:hypothetical protein
MDSPYLSYTVSNIYRNTYVIESKGVKGWFTLRCIQSEYNDNCIIDGIRGARIDTFTIENGKRIKARFSKKENIYIVFDKPNTFPLTPSNVVINGF